MAVRVSHFILITFTLLLTIVVATATSASKAPKLVNVINILKFGAKPDGRTDTTRALQSAWASACSSNKPATIYVPTGRFFLQSAYFDGEHCNNKAINIVIDGTLLAPDYRSTRTTGWIRFEKVIGVSISGGVLDGRGNDLWACKASSGGCPTGATTLEFYGSRDIVITRLTSINSQKFHIVIDGCLNVKLQGITISAPGNSPNTDGVHIEHSSGVTVLNSRISTGDDCVSIGPGSSNLWIENINCGPGHGVSIGSLGWSLQEPGVQNVTVKSSTFRSTENGVRIKTWARESNGFVRGVVYEDLTMVNVQNPAIIDQHYCPGERNCPNQVAGVRISDVRYENIHGTSATVVGLKLDCSKEHPCSGIEIEDVNLGYGNGRAHATCVNALGTVASLSCLI